VPAVEDPPPAPATEQEEPGFVPVGEIGGRAEAVEARLGEIRTELASAALQERIEGSLPETKAGIASRAAELEDLFSGGYQLGQLQALEAGWLTVDERLAAQERDLAKRATELDTWMGEIGEQQEVWSRTRAEARRASAPQTTLGQVGAVLEALAATGRALEQRRNSVLTLESRVREQRSSVRAALESINAAGRALRATVFVRQEEPVWRVRVVDEVREDFDSVAGVLTKAGAGVTRYASRHADRLLVHALLIAVFLWAIRWARSVPGRRSASLGPPADSATEGRDALAYTWAAALLLGLSLTRALHPEAPVGFRSVVALVALAPWLRVLSGLLPTALRASLYGLAVLLVASFLYQVLAELQFLARLILIAEFAGGLVWLLWLRRPERLHHFPSFLGRNLWFRALDGWLRLSLGAFAVGLAAGLLGYRVLATLISELVIWGAFLGTLFVAAVRIVEALLEAFVDAGRLDRLRMVRTDRELVLKVTRRGLRVLGAWATAPPPFHSGP
jgi:hypothetical protein